MGTCIRFKCCIT